VFWTFPVCGGYGFVLPEEECLFMEAVLVNPQAELPETVRLAWLLGHQLLWQWLDRTQVRPETARAVSLALLGPVLEAARYVEWLGGDAPSVHEVAPLWMDRPITAREYRCLEELWNGPKDPDALLAGVAALEKAIACSDAEPAEDGGG
jgi:hypothetical protein